VVSNKLAFHAFDDITCCNYLLFFIALSSHMHQLPLSLTSEDLFPYKPG